MEKEQEKQTKKYKCPDCGKEWDTLAEYLMCNHLMP